MNQKEHNTDQFERNSFTFFESFYTASKSLSEKQRAKYFDAIFQYALYGRKIELTGTVRALFELSEPVLNKGISQYKNGKKTGKAEKPTESQPTENKKPTESQNKNGFSDSESESKPTPLEEKEIGIGKGIGEGNKEMDKECVKGEDGSAAVDGNTPDTPQKPDAFVVIKEAAVLGHTMTESEAREFLEYNEASGWKLEWKYALKRWIQQEKQKPREKPKLKNDVSERHVYDMDELRRRAKA